MTIRVKELWQCRILGYNHLGGVEASSICDAEDAQRTINDMMRVPNVKTTHNTGPMLISRTVIDDE